MLFVLQEMETAINELESALDDDMTIEDAQSLVADHVQDLRLHLNSIESNLEHPE